MTDTTADFLLDDDWLDHLTAEEAEEYHRLLDTATAGVWALDANPKAQMLHLLASKVDWTLGGGSAGGGKALALDTPIATTRGWSTMAELSVGDEVFAPDGSPVPVVAKSDVEVLDGWQLTFNDGTTVAACDSHRWLTLTNADMHALTSRAPDWKARRRAGRPSRSVLPEGHPQRERQAARNRQMALDRPSLPLPTGEIRTTAEIVASLVTTRGRSNHFIPLAQPLVLPDVELPIDPYLLGAWLGDGSRASGQITTMDAEIVAAFDKAGFPVDRVILKPGNRAATYGFAGWYRTLRLAGFINNKHVPAAYLWASEDQRRALLQGLMDTDGTINKDGQCEFDNTNHGLVQDVAHLLRSLGMRCAIREGVAKLNGRMIGPRWRVKFTPTMPVFRLQRKLARQVPVPSRRTRFRTIVAAQRVRLPMQCVQIANDDGMYLATESLIPTHNSEALAYHARETAAKVPGSHTLVLRSSKPELRRSFILRTLVRFAQTGDAKRAKYAERTNVVAWWWNNGSIIEFGYAAREEDAGQYLSAEYDLVLIDESTQLDPKTIAMICGRLRTTKAKAELGARPHAVFATNPGDIGHEWHKELFVDLTEHGRYVVVLDISQGFMDNDGLIDWEKCSIVERVLAPTTPRECLDFQITTDPERHLSVAFVPFSARDNPYLDPSVMRGLNSLPEMERRQKRDGDWDAFTGRYFTEFNRRIHIVTPFEIPADWEHGIGLDHGFSAPFGALFGAWDSDGNCWIWNEVYERRLTPAQQAALVQSRLVRFDAKRNTNVTIRTRTPVADPAVFSEKGEGNSIAAQWAAAGLRCIAANNARIDGWMNVREYLRVPIIPSDDGPVEGAPKLFIFESCTSLIREIVNARQDRRRPDDVDTTGDDHLLDCMRYLLATRPRRMRKRDDPHRGLEGLERREAVRLDKFRKMTKRTMRNLGLEIT